MNCCFDSAVVLLPVLCIASLLPLGYLGNRGMVPDKDLAGVAAHAYLAPVQWAYENGPIPLKAAIKRLDEAAMP